MSEHGVRALLGRPPESIAKLALDHMRNVHGSTNGRIDSSFPYYDEYSAHVLYLLDLRGQGKPLKFPET